MDIMDVEVNNENNVTSKWSLTLFKFVDISVILAIILWEILNNKEVDNINSIALGFYKALVKHDSQNSTTNRARYVKLFTNDTNSSSKILSNKITNFLGNIQKQITNDDINEAFFNCIVENISLDYTYHHMNVKEVFKYKKDDDSEIYWGVLVQDNEDNLRFIGLYESEDVADAAFTTFKDNGYKHSINENVNQKDHEYVDHIYKLGTGKHKFQYIIYIYIYICSNIFIGTIFIVIFSVK